MRVSLFPPGTVTKFSARCITGSSSSRSTWSSERIRETFVTYFCQEYDHRFVSSSKTVPAGGKSEGTYFTNAGMNQFKPIFSGSVSPDSEMASHDRVVNSQKCVRVGGKHNDLQDVGRDSYHHTFFEMLGSWSFGDYFKREICEMSWRLLTDVYKLAPDRLYVTYFAGSDEWQLGADDECRAIWRDIGLPANRILPYGVADNFWLMGDVGPCGPCSEIHYDHVGNRDAATLVNRQCPSVTELWNLVFMQYDRQTDGTLRRLPRNHIDTGMGLERLTAILQDKTSNYDTDLFLPIVRSIEKLSGTRAYTGLFDAPEGGRETDTDTVSAVETDTAYRIVADHIRMMSVVVADGLLPGKQDLGHKLRQIMYRCYHQAYHVLGAPPGMVASLVDDVVASLGHFYPELRQNYSRIKSVIAATEEQYFASLIQPKRRINRSHQPNRASQTNEVSEKNRGAERSFLDQFTLQKLQENSVPVTDDSHKYTFLRSQDGFYEFANLDSRIVAILNADRVVDHVSGEGSFGLLVERTNYYARAGGQVSDLGRITTATGAVFEVDRLEKNQNYVLHVGRLVTGTMTNGDDVSLQIDQTRRLHCMRNHTATHVIQAALKDVLGDDVTQRGSLVGPEYLTFDFSYLGKLTGDHLLRVQTFLDEMVARNLLVTRSQMALSEAERLPGLVKIEGEIYPRNVNVVQIGDQSESLSAELCGGTHVTNTTDLVAVVITNASGVSQGTKRITALSGDSARMVLDECVRLREHVDHLAEDIRTKVRPDHWNQRIKAIDTVFSTRTLPKSEKDEIYKRFDPLRAQAADYLNKTERERLKQEISLALTSTPANELTFVESDIQNRKQVLRVLAKLSPTRPVIVHGKSNIKPWICVAYVPKTLPFTAADWLNHGLREVTSACHVTHKNPEYESVICDEDVDYDKFAEKMRTFPKS